MPRPWLRALALALPLIASPFATLAVDETDEAGRVVRSVDEEGNETLYVYDEQGRLVAKHHSDGRVERFDVDPEGQD